MSRGSYRKSSESPRVTGGTLFGTCIMQKSLANQRVRVPLHLVNANEEFGIPRPN